MTNTDTAAATFGREFNAARQAQGFKSQADLDAFYAHCDHVAACTDCRPSAVFIDDSWQGSTRECDEAVRLFLASIPS